MQVTKLLDAQSCDLLRVYSAECYLETNSFHQNVRLIYDVDTYFFLKQYFDLRSECVLQ